MRDRKTSPRSGELSNGTRDAGDAGRQGPRMRRPKLCSNPCQQFIFLIAIVDAASNFALVRTLIVNQTEESMSDEKQVIKN